MASKLTYIAMSVIFILIVLSYIFKRYDGNYFHVLQNNDRITYFKSKCRGKHSSSGDSQTYTPPISFKKLVEQDKDHRFCKI